jgi:hypothetical protein
VPVQVLGWVFVLAGLLFLLLGLAGAVRATLIGRGATRGPHPAAWATLSSAVRGLLAALVAAPVWLGCALLGLVLFFLGARVALYGVNLLAGFGVN